MQLKSFVSGEFLFRNYTECSLEENRQILHWRNDKAIRQWMANDRPIAEVEHLRFVERLRNDAERAYFAVFFHEQYVASIYMTDLTDNKGERGIYVVPAFQGKGTTQNIELAFLKYLRDKGIRYVFAKVKIRNERSARYHIKMGYIEEKRDDEYIFYKLDTEMITIS